MSFSNNTISAPITIDDVKSALGESSNDLGTLCKSGNINKWAKYKPVKYASVSGAIESVYRATDGKCGLSFDVFGNSTSAVGVVELLQRNATACTNLITHIKANAAWAYVPPSGGASAPYRLGDFKGYRTLGSNDDEEEHRPMHYGGNTKGQRNTVNIGSGLIMSLSLGNLDTNEGVSTGFLTFSDFSAVYDAHNTTSRSYDMNSAKAAVIIFDQATDPIDNGITASGVIQQLFTANGYLRDNVTEVEVTNMAVLPENRDFYVLTGAVFGQNSNGNYTNFVCAPWDNTHYPFKKYYLNTSTASLFVYGDILRWSTYADKTWHNIKWQETDDAFYAKPTTSSYYYFELGLNVRNASYTPSSSTIECTFTYASGSSKTYNPTIVNTSFAALSSPSTITTSGSVSGSGYYSSQKYNGKVCIWVDGCSIVNGKVTSVKIVFKNGTVTNGQITVGMYGTTDTTKYDY